MLPYVEQADEENEDEQGQAGIADDGSSSNNSSLASLRLIDKHSAIEYLEKVLSTTDPSNHNMYENYFVTSEELKTLLEERFDNVPSAGQVEKWVAEKGSFGTRVQHRMGDKKSEVVISLFSAQFSVVKLKKKKKGTKRWKLTHCLAQLPRQGRRELRKYFQKNIMMTIGYARKSKTGETPITKSNCLQNMVDTLVTLGCDRIFAAVVNANEPLLKNSSELPIAIRDKLRGVSGDLNGNLKPKRTIEKREVSFFFF